MPCDHISVVVPTLKIDQLIEFLLASLGELGYKVCMRPCSTFVGMGDGQPWLWLSGIDEDSLDAETLAKVNSRAHVAFSADTPEQVRSFHAAALKAGGTCNGPPGLRVDYHPGYYGAFVRDPVCGINWEVVTHKGGDGK